MEQVTAVRPVDLPTEQVYRRLVYTQRMIASWSGVVLPLRRHQPPNIFLLIECHLV